MSVIVPPKKTFKLPACLPAPSKPHFLLTLKCTKAL